MEELNVRAEQTNGQPQTAEAEVNEGGKEPSVSLGKFKDVNALLNAYNSLQAEFTKRCQRIKELEGTSDKVQTPLKGDIEQQTDVREKPTVTEEDKQQILKDYLREILQDQQKAIVMDDRGVAVRTPVVKPKSIAEAGMLAKEML